MSPAIWLYIFIALAIVLLIIILCAVARSAADAADAEIDRLITLDVPPDLINDVLKGYRP